MDTFSSHHGVLSLFPIAFGLIDSKTQKDRLTNAIQFGLDENEMLSPFGLRGVSVRDE